MTATTAVVPMMTATMAAGVPTIASMIAGAVMIATTTEAGTMATMVTAAAATRRGGLRSAAMVATHRGDRRAAAIAATSHAIAWTTGGEATDPAIGVASALRSSTNSGVLFRRLVGQRHLLPSGGASRRRRASAAAASAASASARSVRSGGRVVPIPTRMTEARRTTANHSIPRGATHHSTHMMQPPSGT